MAELVVTMVVEPLVKIVMKKVSSDLLDQYKVMKGMEEQHDILKRKLLLILDIITEVEQAAAHKQGAAAWLEAIKKVAYQANEVFDEFKYEALRRQAKKDGHYKKLGFGVVKLFPTHNRYVFRNRMGRKLHKIVQAIEVLVTEMNAFGFKYQRQPPVSKQWRQTDHAIFDPKEITRRSRKEDVMNIVGMLLDRTDNADLKVVPIVGMGGLGKTTLAQLVYNDGHIQGNFRYLLWVSVSDNFDVDYVAKSILEAAPEKKGNGTPLDRLQNLLRKERYLLVLDDVRTREVHKWEQLKARLQHGGRGSVILITTRDQGVAEIMGTVKAYNLKALEDQFIKKIIKTRAFNCYQKKEERPIVLVNMVDEIVKRCVGSPLAATSLGFVLGTKTSEEEWKTILSRSSICIKETGMLPILKLSYDNLPSYMKQCFAFCAIFPKGYEIDVDKLIQLWIAHGFIQEKEAHLETIGKKVFDELASMSFFQDVKQVQATVQDTEDVRSCYSRTTCRIHDLMHDVALSVMEQECALATEQPGKIEYVAATAEPSQSEWLPNTARHLFLSGKEPGKKLNSCMKKCSPAIQTLLCDSYMESSLQHRPKYSSLQALQLCSKRRSFPLKPKHLHHLRYLDLSRSHIEALPEDISILYNLQTLNLSGCQNLVGLPRHMQYMTALRHLYTHGCSKLMGMPREIGKLTSLQTLTCFVAASGSNCSNVRELGNLNLGGQLELRHLANVKEEDAKAANLVKKKELRELTLKWDDVLEETSSGDDARVLEKLKPHDGLHAIRIHSYGATTFPTWMAMLQNIVEIHLFHCEKLQWLFSCDCDAPFTFPNLKQLALERLSCLEKWREIDNGMLGEEIMFPQLENLFISGCEKLTALPGQQTFPNLQNVHIEGCPKLTNAALSCLEKWCEIDNNVLEEEIMFPRLENLFISGCEKLTALPGQQTFPNLQNLHIEGCPKLTTAAKSPKLSVLGMEGYEAELFHWIARHMTSLTNMVLTSIEGSTETTSAATEHGLREVLVAKEKCYYYDIPLAVMVLRDFKSGVTELCACFVHLQELEILNSHSLVHWPEKEFQPLVHLKKLMIDGCNNLTGYAQAPAEQSTSTEYMEWMHPFLPILESLKIRNCHNLVEVFNIKAYLSIMHISNCGKLESICGRSLQQGQSSSPRAGVRNLRELVLQRCDGLTGVLHLPQSLKELKIEHCCGFTSLESRSGELTSLENLEVRSCSTLSSLPDGPEAYSSLQRLTIRDSPGLKTLPTSLKQRLGSIQEEYVDSHYYGNKLMLLKPKTWKYAIRRD